MTKNEETILNDFIKGLANHPNRTVIKFPDEEDAHMVIRMTDVISEVNKLVARLEDEREEE